MIENTALYMIGMGAAFIAIIIAFYAMVRERDDLHRLLLTDLAEIIALFIIALLATDLAEALILPGLVVGISELMALSELYLVKEGFTTPPVPSPRIEVMDSAPAILAAIMVIYGIVLSGFSGGAVAGIGVIFYLMCIKSTERFELMETLSGYAWVFWIIAFFIFMILPQYWFFAVMLAGSAILIKVSAKMSLLGTFYGGDGHV